jgi:hypothetical protein
MVKNASINEQSLQERIAVLISSVRAHLSQSLSAPPPQPKEALQVQ